MFTLICVCLCVCGVCVNNDSMPRVRGGFKVIEQRFEAGAAYRRVKGHRGVCAV